MPLMLLITRSVCSPIVLPTISPVFGSSATCPDMYNTLLAFTACEYGPMGLGPRSVNTISLIESPLVISPCKNRCAVSGGCVAFVARTKLFRHARMLHPVANELSGVVFAGFLVKGGNQVRKLKTAATPRCQ